MKIKLKLYASFAQYLPASAQDNQVVLDVQPTTTPLEVLTQFNVPEEELHLVLINGVFIPPDRRQEPMAANDELAVWPAIAGG